jgi:hypothetical protein
VALGPADPNCRQSLPGPSDWLRRSTPGSRLFDLISKLHERASLIVKLQHVVRQVEPPVRRRRDDHGAARFDSPIGATSSSWAMAGGASINAADPLRSGARYTIENARYCRSRGRVALRLTQLRHDPEDHRKPTAQVPHPGQVRRRKPVTGGGLLLRRAGFRASPCRSIISRALRGWSSKGRTSLQPSRRAGSRRNWERS